MKVHRVCIAVAVALYLDRRTVYEPGDSR